MITVITAAYGEDTLQDQCVQNTPCRWLAVTDHTIGHAGPWEKTYEPRPHLSPRVAAKIPKYMPGIYVEMGTPVLWIDASVRIVHPGFVVRVMNVVRDAMWMHLREVIAMMPHPDRSTIRDEYPHAAAQGRYREQMVERQALSYLEDLEFRDDSLWATTVIGRIATPQTEAFGGAWMCENVVWTAQDQISCPWVAQKLGQEIWPVHINLWDNEYFILRERAVDV